MSQAAHAQRECSERGSGYSTPETGESVPKNQPSAAHAQREGSERNVESSAPNGRNNASGEESSASRDKFHLGFLRIVESAAGAVGGLLVTNRLGRPLEFQCTTPVRANRTQEILYGPTLRPFLHSELIGKTLVERLQVKPDLILIDQPSLLDLRTQIDVPVACLVSDEANDLPDPMRVQLGSQSVHVHRDHQPDADVIARQTQHITADADLSEPLDRVKEALLETTRPGAVA